jgi:hypothetical protein
MRWGEDRQSEETTEGNNLQTPYLATDTEKSTREIEYLSGPDKESGHNEDSTLFARRNNLREGQI